MLKWDFSISNTASRKGWFIIEVSFVRPSLNYGKEIILTRGLLTALMTLPLLKSPKAQLPIKSKKFQETNSVETIKNTGRPRFVRMPNFQRLTKAKIVSLQWKLACEASEDKSSMWRIIKKDIIFLKNVTSKFGVFNIFKTNKINIKYTFWKT